MKRNYIIDTIIDSGLVEPGMTIVTGVSGGPDSLCLLHALASIADMYDLTIIPVHVNHMLRAEAEQECENVERFCERLDLECQVFESDCKTLAGETGVSVEEAGRIIRYQIFDEVADDAADMGVPEEKLAIAVAHNADDQAETVLFRLLRGTGPHGLAGIPAFRMSESGHLIIRPLLTVGRHEIEQYIKDHRLRPNIDKSNKDNSYMRNRIRNELIPYLEKNFNPRIKENLRRYADLAYMDDALLREVALGDYILYASVRTQGSEKIVIDISKIKSNPVPVNSRIVITALDVLGLREFTSFDTVAAVTELIYGSNPSAGVDLPEGFRVRREYDSLIFSDDADSGKISPDDSLSIHPQVIPVREFTSDDDADHAAFDFDKFNAEYPGRLGDITLRTRREGDYLPMKQGRKKIQDLLVDSKVKKNARDSILMVCIDSEVLWILPSEHFAGEQEKSKGRFSPKFHIDDSTQRVLFIELTETI